MALLNYSICLGIDIALSLGIDIAARLIYFVGLQDQADAWVAECVDARKPVKSWKWDELRKRVK